MKPNRNSKRALIDRANTMVFVAAIVSSVFISMGLVVSKLLWDQHSFNERVISEKEKARDTLKANLAEIDDLKRNLETLDQSSTNSKVVLDALPSKYDFPAVASSLDFLSEQAAISRDKFEFTGKDQGAKEEKSTNPKPVAMPFTATVTDNSQKVFDFVINTERSIRPFKVGTLTLKAAQGGQVELQMQAETFYQPSKNLELTTKELKYGGSSTTSKTGTKK